jgi:hypothetical protein
MAHPEAVPHEDSAGPDPRPQLAQHDVALYDLSDPG